MYVNPSVKQAEVVHYIVFSYHFPNCSESTNCPGISFQGSLLHISNATCELTFPFLFNPKYYSNRFEINIKFFPRFSPRESNIDYYNQKKVYVFEKQLTIQDYSSITVKLSRFELRVVGKFVKAAVKYGRKTRILFTRLAIYCGGSAHLYPELAWIWYKNYM